VTVLGIESATSVCAVALVRDGQVEREELVEEDFIHARKLLTILEKVLRESGLTARQVPGVAVSIGPGSFTGLRIGLSVAKGFVFATGAALVGVPTLEALARKVLERGAAALPPYVLSVLDARRDDFYCQLFALEDGHVKACWPAKDLTAAEVLREIEGRTLLVTGNGRNKLRQALAEPTRHHTGCSFADDDLARCSAGTVALIGEELLRQGRADDPALLEPRYIKEFFLQQRSA
jgi:tRNA threonylcarbamoyladenosine biosynthesis protein TsaB